MDDDGAFSTLLELSGEQYLLDNSREWTLSFQTTQAVDDRVVVEISLRQVLGALSQVSYQLWKGDEILESAFERQWDKLCVPRQLAELLKLPLTEVLSDFDTICERGWQERGVSLKDIRKFCVWRGAPMFFVNCRGQLMGDQPVEKEARAVAFTAWDGHAFQMRGPSTFAMRRSASSPGTGQSDETPQRRSSPGGWNGTDNCVRATSGLGTCARPRVDLLSEGHCPKVAMRSLREWRAQATPTASSTSYRRKRQICRHGRRGWA